MLRVLAPIFCLMLLGCGQRQSLAKSAEPQLTTLHRKQVKIWQAELVEGTPVYRLNPARGILEPTTKPVFYERSVLLKDHINQQVIRPGWVAIQQVGTLEDDFYFVRDSQLYDHREVESSAWSFNAHQCPFFVLTDDGRLTPSGKLSETGFGFPLDPFRPTRVGSYVRVLLDSGRTAYASSHCVHFGSTKARATLSRIRERIQNAPLRAWEVRDPNSIQPDFESSVHQFIEPLLYAVSLPEYEAAVRFDFWSEIENAVVAIFTARIEAVSVDTVIPGIWGFPTAQLTPTQVALLATALPMLNGMHLANNGGAYLNAYFIDPEHGTPDLSCLQPAPPDTQARQQADELLRAHIDGDIDWLNTAVDITDYFRLASTPETDTLDALVYAFSILTDREAAFGLSPGLVFATGNELGVQVQKLMVHTHVPAPALRQSDLAGIPEAARFQFFARLDSEPTIEHSLQRWGVRGASAVFIINFDDDPVYLLAPDCDVSAAALLSNHLTRIVVPCPGPDGKPYEVWEHFNDLSGASEWRTPFGRVTLQPTIP